MNTLIANQYGRVQGEAGGCGLTLCVTAQTPRREWVELQTRVDSIEQQLHLLAILRAVERRIEQFQLRDGNTPQQTEPQSPFDETICGEEDLFRSNGSRSKDNIYVRFSQFLVYERVGQGRHIRNRERLWLTCGYSIRMTAASIRDWSSGPRNCASWEYRTRSSRPPQNLIRRDFFYSTTCRIRRSQQPALPTNPQRQNPQLKSGGARCTKRRKTQ